MTAEADTIHADVSEADDGVAAFLSSFDDEPKKKAVPSESAEGAPEESETETEDQPEQTEEGEPEEAAEDTAADPEDQEFEVKVNGETKKATLRELKRLYGQESALTQRSQKLAEAQREAEALQTRAGAALKAMLDKAKERNSQYASWGPAEWAQIAASVQTGMMTADDFKTLREDAAKAAADVKFLEEELDGHIKGQREGELKARHEQAVQCIKTLQDASSPFHIEGFDKGPYEEMMTFAEKLGIPEARSVVSPGAIKVLHMAMQWARHMEASKAAEKKVQKVRENPQRVMKPGTARQPQDSDSKRAAMKRLREVGDLDSASAAFEASF